MVCEIKGICAAFPKKWLCMMIVMVKASSKFLGSISGGAIDENCRTITTNE